MPAVHMWYIYFARLQYAKIFAKIARSCLPKIRVVSALRPAEASLKTGPPPPHRQALHPPRFIHTAVSSLVLSICSRTGEQHVPTAATERGRGVSTTAA